jgi:glycerol-1-phosphate dehydrogenase [NAD(P)+]
MKPYCQSYLDRYDENGVLHCDCGGDHHLQTRQILLGEGVVERLADALSTRYGSASKIWILSDENTDEAAGRRCKRMLAGFTCSGTVLPADPRPRTSPALIRTLSEEAGKGFPDIVLAVGGGTISDLAKMVSEDLDIPNWCVPTAPSVDAYSSGTSALKMSYQHKTEPARPAELIIADLDILQKAPQLLFLSGAGDLLAKYLSYLDWRLSALITGETICENTACLCLESARQALAAVKTSAYDGPAAVHSLTDAILLSGLAMQALVSSRPASSAEHTIAHFWELDEGVGNPDMELHGLLVGISSRILMMLYQEFFRDSSFWTFDLEDRLERLAAEPAWERALTGEVRRFHRQMREEMEACESSRAMIASRLETVLNKRDSIRDLAGSLLQELEQAITVLGDIGFPFRLSDFSFDPERAFLPIRYIRFLRSRYSAFNLMHEVGAEQRVLGVLDQRIELIR